jgi:hypothetical protein
VSIDDGKGGKKDVPYQPHSDDYQRGENPALGLQAIINESEFARLFAGKFKTFEYDIALEGNNLQSMMPVAADLWPVQDGPVVRKLNSDAELDFESMKPEEKAPYAHALLERIDTDEIGKGVYAQAFADKLERLEGEFVVPDYILQAVLWACGLPERAEQ